GAASPIGWFVRVSTTFEDYPLPPRLVHALDQHVVSEVELVVAERGEIEAGGVERRDHLLAPEHARRDRRREEITGQHQKRRPALRGEPPLQARDARQPCRRRRSGSWNRRR